MPSSERRREIIAALRNGTVPQRGLELLSVGLDRFEPVVASELATVAGGGAIYKAVRNEYGCGKTFFARWIQEFAKKQGFAAAEVQIFETETPLHRLETVYRRAIGSSDSSRLPSGCMAAGNELASKPKRPEVSQVGCQPQLPTICLP